MFVRVEVFASNYPYTSATGQLNLTDSFSDVRRVHIKRWSVRFGNENIELNFTLT